jgi:hypothetical protein
LALKNIPNRIDPAAGVLYLARFSFLVARKIVPKLVAGLRHFVSFSFVLRSGNEKLAKPAVCSYFRPHFGNQASLLPRSDEKSPPCGRAFHS